MGKLTARNNSFLALVKREANAKIYATVLDAVNDPNNGTTRDATVIAIAFLLQFYTSVSRMATSYHLANATSIDSIETEEIATKARVLLDAVDRSIEAPTILVLRRVARKLAEVAS